jgi:hypothetical protein
VGFFIVFFIFLFSLSPQQRYNIVYQVTQAARFYLATIFFNP